MESKISSLAYNCLMTNLEWKKENTKPLRSKGKGKAVSAVTGLEWPRGFQEVKVPRFHDNGTGW
jgi:hypothetical protein